MSTTTSKMTPGPWNVIEGRTLLHIETDANNPIGAGISICSIPKGGKNISGFGNADLIAAAPLLFSTLEVLLEECERIDNYGDGFSRELMDKASTALKIARGGR